MNDMTPQTAAKADAPRLPVFQQFIDELRVELCGALEESSTEVARFFRALECAGERKVAARGVVERRIDFAGFEFAEAREVTFVQWKRDVARRFGETAFDEHAREVRRRDGRRRAAAHLRVCVFGRRECAGDWGREGDGKCQSASAAGEERRERGEEALHGGLTIVTRRLSERVAGEDCARAMVASGCGAS